jgi:hypothetical protein
MKDSPYATAQVSQWQRITQRLVDKHPLRSDEIVEIVLASWDSIFESRFGPKQFRIGVHIFPKPQSMGFLLHELIPLELQTRYPAAWRGDASADEKDLVYIPDDAFSVEIKTSSNPSHIYGNRSYAQKSSNGKKAKSGYYLALNFEPFSKDRTIRPKIVRVRFGWLDANDWVGQKAPTGQQSHLPSEIEKGKFIELYRPSGKNVSC